VWYVAVTEIVHVHRQSTRTVSQVAIWWISLHDTLRYLWTYRPKHTAMLLMPFLIVDFIGKSALHVAAGAVRRTRGGARPA
jgi:hypothetical protein